MGFIPALSTSEFTFPRGMTDTKDIVAIGTALPDNNKTTTLASPTPTTTTFTVASGKGVNFPAGSLIHVNGQSVVVQTQAGDAITVFPALTGAPAAGSVISLGVLISVIGTF
jgi:hypothetical protein